MTEQQPIARTKLQRARQLPVGTWFLWPPAALPQRHKFYHVGIYQVIRQGETITVSERIYRNIGFWEYPETDVLSPSAIERHVQQIVDALNEQHADAAQAHAYIDAYTHILKVEAIDRLPDRFGEPTS